MMNDEWWMMYDILTPIIMHHCCHYLSSYYESPYYYRYRYRYRSLSLSLIIAIAHYCAHTYAAIDLIINHQLSIINYQSSIFYTYNKSNHQLWIINHISTINILSHNKSTDVGVMSFIINHKNLIIFAHQLHILIEDLCGWL